ncbi:hypothetical protein KTO58_10720 [Chitinophaga pendula]|uniref:HYC_CC_PP family protein n=1 Tax=Chitinophaga TaxID=79328 RepID=UPI000BAE710D|nr:MULTISPECIES: hypothetical protein [Chitinophaga]ASZ12744.1 hypothetical protein CK934_18180 [Chitinophaga sp. MD30]UCJ09636.1 hypothetical protein KTO58_10720 [Chitinophaga pendula]
MKRFLTTILAIIYLASASGAGIQLHYCMGQLVSMDTVSQTPATPTPCPMCGMKQSSQQHNGCCKHEQRSVTEKDQETNTHLLQSDTAACPLAIPIPVFHNRPAVTGIQVPATDVTYPIPPLTDIPLFTLHRTWLI